MDPQLPQHVYGVPPGQPVGVGPAQPVYQVVSPVVSPAVTMRYRISKNFCTGDPDGICEHEYMRSFEGRLAPHEWEQIVHDINCRVAHFTTGKITFLYLIVILAFFISIVVSFSVGMNYNGPYSGEHFLTFFWIFLSIYIVSTITFIVYKRNRQFAFCRAMDQHCRELTSYWSTRGLHFRFREEGCGKYVAWFVEIDILGSVVQAPYPAVPPVPYPPQPTIYSVYQTQPPASEPATPAPPSKEETSSLLSQNSSTII